MKELAKLLIEALLADGILDDDYIERRAKRYRDNVEQGAIKKNHPDKIKTITQKPKKLSDTEKLALELKKVQKEKCYQKLNTENKSKARE